MWLAVLKGAAKPVAVERCKAEAFEALFIAGGAKMLRDLRHSDLSGHSPSPFCATLHALATGMLDAGGVVGAVGHGVRGLPAAEHERRFCGNVDSEAESTARAMVAALASGKSASSTAAIAASAFAIALLVSFQGRTWA